MSAIPCTVSDFTPQAVTRLLSSRPDWADARISALEAVRVGTGQMAHSFRLTLDYESRPENAPASVMAKISSTDPTSRQMGIATGAYQREVLFYKDVAGLTDVRAPQCYHADIAEAGDDFILLLEDMGPATTVEQIGGCTADQADLALEQAATLHAGSWGHTGVAEQSWLPIEAIWGALAGAIPQQVEAWLQRFGTYLKPEHIDVANRLGREINAWLNTLREHRTLWPGDFRLDNLLFDAQGGATPIAVVDWQSVATAPGVIDVSYFLGTSLLENDRSAHESSLVDGYHQRLTAQGVTGYSIEQCRQEYRAHALYGLILTIAASMGVESTERGDAMFGAMAGRVAQQILENDSFGALAALVR